MTAITLQRTFSDKVSDFLCKLHHKARYCFYTGCPDTIFIRFETRNEKELFDKRNIGNIMNVLTHEILHDILNKHIGKECCLKLDRIPKERCLP